MTTEFVISLYYLYVLLTAIAIAISDSVTVSMGEETSGAWSIIFLVRAEVKSYTLHDKHTESLYEYNYSR